MFSATAETCGLGVMFWRSKSSILVNLVQKTL